nr:MAG TPA: hypothetical protein [Caudoviricetes sp.]
MGTGIPYQGRGHRSRGQAQASRGGQGQVASTGTGGNPQTAHHYKR